MEDLTQLTERIKSFLAITWEDDDDRIAAMIRSSMERIDNIAGVRLDYMHTDSAEFTDSRMYSMSMLGQELLMNRVFYINEKGLDDFEKNYSQEVLSLYLMGRAYKENPDADES